MREKSIFTVLAITLLSVSMVSVGYGFWTDRLDVEGNAMIQMSVPVIDDVPESVYPETEPVREPSGPSSNTASDCLNQSEQGQPETDVEDESSHDSDTGKDSSAELDSGAELNSESDSESNTEGSDESNTEKEKESVEPVQSGTDESHNDSAENSAADQTMETQE